MRHGGRVRSLVVCGVVGGWMDGCGKWVGGRGWWVSARG